MSFRLLCVDDEPHVLKMREMVFEAAGYQVTSAQSGAEALAFFQAETPDLVVLDYLMPEMHGGIVALEMRKLHPRVPIVFSSACLTIPKNELALVDAFIEKGEPPSMLLTAIEELLAKSELNEISGNVNANPGGCRNS